MPTSTVKKPQSTRNKGAHILTSEYIICGKAIKFVLVLEYLITLQ